jgi:hypothetical protein
VILYEHYADKTRNRLRERLAELQKKRCACCGKKTKRFVLDHDHKTGVIRGAICHRCNNGLGMLDDQIEGVQKAIKYLKAPVSQGLLRSRPPCNWFYFRPLGHAGSADNSNYNRNRQRDKDITDRVNLPKRHEQRRKKKKPAPEPEAIENREPPKLHVVR